MKCRTWIDNPSHEKQIAFLDFMKSDDYLELLLVEPESKELIWEDSVVNVPVALHVDQEQAPYATSTSTYITKTRYIYLFDVKTTTITAELHFTHNGSVATSANDMVMGHNAPLRENGSDLWINSLAPRSPH